MVSVCSGLSAAPAFAAVSPASISASFGVSTIPLNGSTSLSFVIGNPNQSGAPMSVDFMDDFPPGLVMATPNGLSGSCGGTVRAESASVSLTSGALSADTLCKISVNVTGTWGRDIDNPVTVNSSAGTGNTSTASLTVLPPPVTDRVYFVDSVNGSSTISFADLDGSGGGDLNTGTAAVNGPYGLAIDPATARVYWANATANEISFANLDGSGGGNLDTGAATVDSPDGLALDPAVGRLYWPNQDNTVSYANVNNSGGGNLNTSGATVSGPHGIAVDPANGRLYWPNNDSTISFANLDNSGGGDLITGISGYHTPLPLGLAVDTVGGRIYWAENDGPLMNSGTIRSANLDGTGVGDLDTGSAVMNSPFGVAVDPAAGRIYWANELGGGISFASLNGSAAGSVSAIGSAAFPALLLAPAGAGVPVIAGGSAPGSVLSCSPGTWAPDLPGSFLYRALRGFAYQWSAGGTNIAGATSSSFTASAEGDYSCRVSASDFVGSAAQTSVPHTITTPTCGPVSATVTSGQPVIIALMCSDRAGASLTYALDDSPAHGTLTALNAAAGEVTYTPAAGYSGPDAFAYQASSASGTAAEQTVSITVAPSAHGVTITPSRVTCLPLSATAVAGRPATIALSCSDPAGATVTYALQSTPAHGTLTAFSAGSGHATYTPAAHYTGTDAFAYRASSTAGTAAEQTVSITVIPSALPGRPVITKARLTHTRFRVAAQRTAVTARTMTARGTGVLFTLSAPARLQIKLTRATPGMRSGRRCVAPTRKLKQTHAQHCARTLTLGTLTRANEPAGPDRVTFTGRLGRRRLAPNAYQATLTANNASGTSTPVTLTFTVVR